MQTPDNAAPQSGPAGRAAARPQTGMLARTPRGFPGETGWLSQRRTRVLAYGAWLALTFVVSVLVYALSWDGERERHEQRLKTAASMGAKAIDTYLLTLEKSLTVLGEELRQYDNFADATPRLAVFKKAFPEFQIVALTLPDGTSPANSEGPVLGKPPNVGNQPSFQDAIDRLRKGATMVVERPFVGPVSKVRLTKLRYAVKDAAGNVIFTIAAGLPTDTTFIFWRNAPLPSNTGMGLQRDDHYILAQYPRPPPGSPDYSDQPSSGPVSNYLRGHGNPAQGVIRGRAAETGLSSVIVFEQLEHYPLHFFVSDPMQNLRWAWWKSTWPFYFLMLGLLLGGLVIIHLIGKQQVIWVAERERRYLELQALNDKLRATNAETEAANAELSAFSYTVSHDLRAPIRAIDGFTAVLATELGDRASPLAQDMLSRVRANAGRMSELISDLLELSRLSRQEIQRRTVDMQDEVRSVLEELSPLRGKAEVEVLDMPPCDADRVLMHQVWTNLIVNALKYSARTAAPRIRIGFENGAYFVEDNGAGFDMAYVAKLFQIFSRLHADREFSGSGVGLAIVRRIIERHGGTVYARGEQGRGARFSFRIPGVAGQAGAGDIARDSRGQ